MILSHTKTMAVHELQKNVAALSQEKCIAILKHGKPTAYALCPLEYARLLKADAALTDAIREVKALKLELKTLKTGDVKCNTSNF